MNRQSRRPGVRRVAALVVVLVAAAFAATAGATPPELADHPLLQPVDAQNWVDKAELTWDDYIQVPDARPEYYDGIGSTGSQIQYRTAIILVDFPDQPFLITPAGRARTRSATRSRAGRPVAPGEREPTGSTTTTPSRTSTTAARPSTATGWRTRHGRDRRRRRDVRALHDARRAARVRPRRQLQRLGRRPGRLRLSCRRHVQSQHPHRRRQRLAGRHRLHGRRCAASTTSSTSRPATTSRRRGRSSARCSGRRREQIPAAFGPPGAEDGPRPEQRRQPDPELGADAVRRRGRRGGRPSNHWPNAAAAPRPRRRARGRACSRTSSATCAACPTTTTTRSRTTSGTSRATGR